MNQNDWETFFDHHAPDYMQNVFTKDTIAEVDFVAAELKLTPEDTVLDIGCGTGRHSIEMAKRGCHVTGVDLSAGMLAQAQKAADAAGVTVEWIKSNAAAYTAEARFDAAICLCEGAFSLLGADDDPVQRDLTIVRNVYAALKPGGGFILTALNGLRYAHQYTQADVTAGRFNPMTMTEHSTFEFDTPTGKISVPTRERGYVPTELRLMFEIAGFAVDHIWGGTAGTTKRRPLEIDEIELMIVAHKPAG